jgi:hypothetical protein
MNSNNIRMGYVQITEPPIVHPLSSDVWIIGCVGNPLPSEVARGEEHGSEGEEEIA